MGREREDVNVSAISRRDPQFLLRQGFCHPRHDLVVSISTLEAVAAAVLLVLAGTKHEAAEPAHQADGAERRLRRLAASFQPPPGFGVIDFDVPPPVPGEPIEYVDAYEFREPPPRIMMVPPPAYIVDLPPPRRRTRRRCSPSRPPVPPTRRRGARWTRPIRSGGPGFAKRSAGLRLAAAGIPSVIHPATSSAPTQTMTSCWD